MSSKCENCGSSITGNFCKECGKVENQQQGDSGSIISATQNNDVPNMGLIPDREFNNWLPVILFPIVGQILYSLVVMDDFNRYLLRRTQESEMYSEHKKFRSTFFYISVLLIPIFILVLYLIFSTVISAFILNAELDDSTLLNYQLGLMLLALMVMIILPLGPTLYLYYKHSVLNRFIDIKQTLAVQGLPFDQSRVDVKRKTLPFYALTLASGLTLLLGPIVLLVTLSLTAVIIVGTLVLGLVAGSSVIWILSEKEWHNTMYGMLKLEYQSV